MIRSGLQTNLTWGAKQQNALRVLSQMVVPGVRMSVGRTNLVVTTDEAGAFVLESVPPGRIDLYVDARSSTFQGKTWPALHFEVMAIRGQDNQLPHPIFLPPLAMSEARMVGGADTIKGVRLD